MGQDKRVFVKDIAYYLFPPDGKPATLAPSLCVDRVNGFAPGGSPGSLMEGGNPTVIPSDMLRKFHFAFLVRHPSRAIPSYYRCTVPPLSEVTGFYNFMPGEAGYDELRRLFDYLRSEHVGWPARAGQPNGVGDRVALTVIDADDLLDHPAEVIESFCREVGIDYTPDMLRWEDEENQKYAAETFEKWKGFHNDVIGSTHLKSRSPCPRNGSAIESEDDEWRKKYGDEAQKVIRDSVNANLAHYEYLKSFALKVSAD